LTLSPWAEWLALQVEPARAEVAHLRADQAAGQVELLPEHLRERPALWLRKLAPGPVEVVLAEVAQTQEVQVSRRG